LKTNNEELIVRTDDLSKQEPMLIIYCKAWCNYLKKLIAFLEEKHYSFMFIDISFDAEKGKQLVSELGDFFLLPVIEIDGALYGKPPISELEKILSDIENQRLSYTSI
tara:strand:- start:1225 stop:1548 length:324 start_codon:yes stop_codon:yes gene_type:complete